MRCKKTIIVKAIILMGLSLPLQADLVITQLANNGVMVTEGETRIMIDGMVVESYSVYGGLPPEAASEYKQVSGAFADVDLALVSHRHHDHNQPLYACNFSKASEGTQLVSSSQVLGLMREKCRTFITTSPRVREIDPQYGDPYVFERAGAKITVFPLSHGTRKYARIQNYGHLIEIGGLKVLHIGDAAMDPTDFQRAGLDQIKVDVAMIPFWFFQPGPGADVVASFMNAPMKIAVHIPPKEMAEVQSYMSENFPQVTILERPLQQARFNSTVKQSR